MQAKAANLAAQLAAIDAETFNRKAIMDRGYAYQVARLATYMTHIDEEKVGIAMRSAVGLVGRREADAIAADHWVYKHQDTSVLEQRTLALAQVLRDDLNVPLNIYEPLIADASARRPIVPPNTMSPGIIEPELLRMNEDTRLEAAEIARWRDQCDRAVEYHREVMYSRAAELDNHADHLDIRGVAFADKIADETREANFQLALLERYQASNDGGANFAYGIESAQLKAALHTTRAEQANFEAQRTGLEAQALRHQAEATRHQADYDVHATKVLQMERVEAMIGQYWTQADVFRSTQAAILTIQRKALADATTAFEESKVVWKQMEAVQRSASELEPSITESRIQIESLAVTGKRLLADVQAVERGRMLAGGAGDATQTIAAETRMAIDHKRGVVERARSNWDLPVGDRLGGNNHQESTAKQSTGIGSRK